MNKIETATGGADETQARALISSAIMLLGSRVPAEFTQRLFGRAAPEDLVRYKPAELAQLAANAWMFLVDRPVTTPKIRVVVPPFEAGGELKNIAVVELVNDDKPFLLDSVMGELAECGLDVRLVAHPVFTIERDETGRLLGLPIAAAVGEAIRRESVIHIHIERIDDEARRADLAARLGEVMTEVAHAVTDWREMLTRTGEVVAELKANPPPLPVDEIAEAIQFLEWLMRDNYVFLGFRADAYDRAAGALVLGSALGILRDQEGDVLTGGERSGMSAEARAFLDEPKPLVVIKSSRRSRVHRRAAMDVVLVKHYDADGRLAGVFRLVGLFTSSAYIRSTRGIPFLRRKTAAVVERAGFDPGSHSFKSLGNVLEHYPRDELFQIDDDTLFQSALAILQLEERPRVRVLARRDRFDRFVSVIVYLPRDRFESSTRAAIGEMLARAYDGRLAAFVPFFPEGPLVRVHFTIARAAGARPDPDRGGLETAIEKMVRTWHDALADALAQGHDPERTHALMDKYGKAFSAGYRDAYSADTALADIRVLEGLSAERPLGVTFQERVDDGEGAVSLKVWCYDRPIPLSERVPVLEHMGFKVVDESTYHVQTAGSQAPDFWLHDMTLAPSGGGEVDLAALKGHLEACFLMVMRGLAESDGYNALVLTSGLMWRDVALLRALSRYLRQIRVAYSQDYMWATLVKHAGVANEIVRLFNARFRPDAGGGAQRAQDEAQIVAGIEASLAEIESLDEDRIIRHFVNLVQATVRTNFYQLDGDGQPKDVISFKLDSRKVDGMPLPYPYFEIFVYSPRVEAVHMRFGKVARGGLRWSDRPQDFRTEILGLAKAQQVKNIVIVPVGAKGGFVPKRLPAGDRDAIQAEGIAAYKIFMSAILEISDNIGADGGIVAPPDTVRHDPDDPYLVVAADKGTASFSDIANSVSQEHGFWLDDAFASGGSAGYDHKDMGITARGAWEAVKRHFREMDIDIGTTPFTAVGVGDMSGDVFGNGMLCERTTRLIAAFDHRDIFIDPNPDPESSYDERKRMFELPRSSWQDYDRAKISAGGGVYSRALKEIELTPQAQTALGFSQSKATPQQVMKAILKSPVDLLFFGGIGTYLRASAETDEAAGDRANDAVRVTPPDLRCKVIAEGANLGLTQRGRIEAGAHGVRLNTDAVDNSAGVNTSDIEVNLKIALSIPGRDGRLGLDDRNTLLASMTDEVAALVLRNNYQQTLSLSLSERRGMEDFGFQQRLMQTLESRRLLDRKIEFLPDDMELAERSRRLQPLTRPELAVLLAYAKLSLYEDLLASSVPDDPYLARELKRYFPAAVADRFPDALEHHRLRREIIATQLTNSMINRGGSTLLVRIADQTGAAPDKIAAAFAAVRNAFELIALNTEVESLDNRIPNRLQTDLLIAIQDLLLDRLVWFLRNVDLSGGLDTVVDHYRAGIRTVAGALEAILPADDLSRRAQRIAELRTAGVPDDLARRLADLGALAAGPDIVLIADRSGKDVADVAATYFAAGAYFRLDRVVAAARVIKTTDYFDRLALDRALDSIGEAERRLTAEMMASGGAGAEAVTAWVGTRGEEIERVRLAVHEIAASGLTLSKLSVAASMLGDLARR